MQLHESIVVVPSNRYPRAGRERFYYWTKMTCWKKLKVNYERKWMYERNNNMSKYETVLWILNFRFWSFVFCNTADIFIVSMTRSHLWCSSLTQLYCMCSYYIIWVKIIIVSFGTSMWVWHHILTCALFDKNRSECMLINANENHDTKRSLNFQCGPSDNRLCTGLHLFDFWSTTEKRATTIIVLHTFF